ncbi:hypothetical protein ACFX5Q_31715 [Mesorhizobium sp. IMUNJ 23033]|uniref:hypothetical protein n=1 Tax=Mesorhizobium sp. IMUNJ 23033 TaxID=3378039 RepID=UPI00384EDA91
MMERLRATEEKYKIAREKRDGSWIKFIEELRSDPTILDRLHPTTDTTADSRLVHLWQFLSSRIRGRSRYAIDDLSAVEPIFGTEVTEKFATVLINFANAWKPLLPSERPPEEQRKIFSFETMGLAGMALEAAKTSNWALSIDDDRAERAARYAILELNGFPDYLVRLAEAKPAIVRKVLVAEVNSQLATGDPSEHGILDRLAYSDAKLARLVVPDLEHAMFDEATFPTPLLPKVSDGRPKPSPTHALRTVMASAVLVDDETFGSMQELTINAQAFESRIDQPKGERAINFYETMVVDIARLSYLTNRLYDFGRRRAERVSYVPPTREQLEGELGRDLRIYTSDNEIAVRIQKAMDQEFGKRRNGRDVPNGTDG